MTRGEFGEVGAGFRDNRLLQALLAGYLALWSWLAISPFDRSDWLLENLLAFAMFAALLLGYRRFRFTNTSYCLIAAFMSLHAFGAHYTYAEVPAGYWIKDTFDLGRNHYDRLVHFSFGLLLAYPMREFIVRVIGVRGGWGYVIAVITIMAFSGLFEIIESWVARIVSPELGVAYLGTQGDVWDAQKDSTAALAGALIATLADALHRHYSGRSTPAP